MKYAMPTIRAGMRNAMLLGLTMLSIAVAPPAFAGACTISTNIIVGANYLCQRCTYKIIFVTPKDTTCFNTYEQFSRYGGSQANVETVLVGASIVKQPRNGRATINGATWTYTPNKGFVGEDVFTVERDFIQNTKTVHVVYFESHITVGP